ncbi:hypothetical protein A5806_002633, partial [Enterococcus faecium]
ILQFVYIIYYICILFYKIKKNRKIYFFIMIKII